MCSVFLHQVNGKEVRAAKHQEVVMLLISPSNEIVLDVRHDPPPPGMRVGGATHTVNDTLVLFICGLTKVLSNQT